MLVHCHGLVGCLLEMSHRYQICSCYDSQKARCVLKRLQLKYGDVVMFSHMLQL